MQAVPVILRNERNRMSRSQPIKIGFLPRKVRDTDNRGGPGSSFCRRCLTHQLLFLPGYDIFSAPVILPPFLLFGTAVNVISITSKKLNGGPFGRGFKALDSRCGIIRSPNSRHMTWFAEII